MAGFEVQLLLTCISPPARGDETPTTLSSEEQFQSDKRNDVRIAPLIGFGLPNLFNFGGLLKVSEYVGVGVNVGFIPTLRISYYGQARISYHEFDTYVRLFPFGTGLFLGTGVGYERASGTFTGTLDAGALVSSLPAGANLPSPLIYDSKAELGAWILNPQLGYLFSTDSGFAIGLDIGAQLPISTSQATFRSQLLLPTGTPESVSKQVHTELLEPTNETVRRTLNTIARTPLPTINVRIGWFL